MFRTIYIINFLIIVIKSQVFFGFKNYTEFKTGDFNILISVPHNGKLLPQDIPDRTEDIIGNLFNDPYTRIFAEQLSLEITRLLNKEPFMVINNLDRMKMDPNRNPNQCCSPINENLDCHKTHKEFHDFINEFNKKMSKEFEQSLVIDIHGQYHLENWTEIGYLLSRNELNKPVLVESNKSSLQALKMRSNYDLESLIRGEYSLGAFLERKNYRIVPSPSIKSPGNGRYYSGGYITAAHKSNHSNSIQIELSYLLRTNDSVAKMSAIDFANSIAEFYNFHKFNNKI
ncbi:unnamed protein product [Brachionus calyciflorus]|uniref:N-formylglutamate amidohydrolase n=1 Tax=Brachionus calyciflorus TaxID=104777 RepID=A0A814M1A6_9BILA|nr:unnamed protein product [Brachionus calyciflorus]